LGVLIFKQRKGKEHCFGDEETYFRTASLFKLIDDDTF
jgi:hypothetical protein